MNLSTDFPLYQSPLAMCSMTIITLVFKHIMGDYPVSAETQSSFLASMHLCMMIFCFLCVAGVFCSMVRLKPLSSDEASKSESFANPLRSLGGRKK